jgi:glycosyltransferase involved in cell wall biosynthesis
MKILLLSNCELDSTLGSGKTRLRWSDGLRKLGHQVDVCEPRDFEMSIGTQRLKRFRLALGAMRISSIAHYDLVECFGAEFGLLLRSWHRRSLRPLLVAHTDGGEILARLRTLASNPPKTLGQRLKFQWEQLTHTKLDRLAFREVDAFVCGCQADLKHMRTLGWHPPECCEVVELGLDNEFLEHDFRPNKEHCVAFVGTWSPRKAPATICRVMTNVMRCDKTVWFQIYGASGDKERILPSFPGDIRSRITVHPKVGVKQLSEGVASAKVFFLPSVYEGFGMALAEAMACSCAAVTTPTGFGASLQPGVEASVCDFADEVGMQNSILRLLSDECTRVGMAKSGWERVRAMSWERQVRRLEGLYLHWLSQWQRSGAPFRSGVTQTGRTLS